MTVGEIAGLIAAFAFVLLVGMCVVPLLKLSKLLDELIGAVKDVMILSAMAGKLKKLLADFDWTRADALLPAQQQRAVPWRAAA